MWVTVDGWYAYYKIADSRSMKVAESLLGGRNFPGDVCTDRYKGYRCYPMEKRIICHAHLGRDYQKIVDRGGVGKPIGEQLIKQEAHLFEAWYEFKDGKIDRPTLQGRLLEIAVPYETLLIEGSRCSDSKVAGMCSDIYAHWAATWHFGWVGGAEPTNNTAEQAVRPAVRLRNNSFGTQSPSGSRFVEKMMTVVETCRRQEGVGKLARSEDDVRGVNVAGPHKRAPQAYSL